MRLSAIVAHSTCQLDRPAPNAEGQLGSPGRAARPTSASSSSFLPARRGSPPALGEQAQHGVPATTRRAADLRRGLGPVTDIFSTSFDHLGNRRGDEVDGNEALGKIDGDALAAKFERYLRRRRK